MNVDKENRPPRGVALAGDGKPAHHASNRESITLTPGGRKSRKTKVNDAQQYFEVGKLGRYALRMNEKTRRRETNVMIAKRASLCRIRAYAMLTAWSLWKASSPRLCDHRPSARIAILGPPL